MEIITNHKPIMVTTINQGATFGWLFLISIKGALPMILAVILYCTIEGVPADLSTSHAAIRELYGAEVADKLTYEFVPVEVDDGRFLNWAHSKGDERWSQLGLADNGTCSVPKTPP